MCTCRQVYVYVYACLDMLGTCLSLHVQTLRVTLLVALYVWVCCVYVHVSICVYMQMHRRKGRRC